jgi:molybdopterin-guanine dinucleotide biosynthesis protein A
VVTVPGDVPFLPHDLVERLHAKRRDAGAVLACAASQARIHPVVALWPVSIRVELRSAVQRGIRQAGAFVQAHSHAVVDWPTEPVDPFFNVNTPDDLREAERLAEIRPGP